MSNMSFRINEEEHSLLTSCVTANQPNLDEDRILRAWELLKKEKTYDQETVWRELGV